MLCELLRWIILPCPQFKICAATFSAFLHDCSASHTCSVIPSFVEVHMSVPAQIHLWLFLLLNQGEPERAPHKSVGGCMYVRPYVRPRVSKIYVAHKFLFQRLRVYTSIACPKVCIHMWNTCLQLAVAMTNNKGKRTATG